jgi:predicted aldo/keto reductase-like oxidoreductase
MALAPGLPEVCRLGLATRGNGHLRPADVEAAISAGINYLNWCGHLDGLSAAIADLGKQRKQVVVAVQFEARTATGAEREFCSILESLQTDYIDIATLYYVEAQPEWDEIVAPDGAWQYLAGQKRRRRLNMIGLTSHQRPLAAKWAQSGCLDMLMIRYNAAHRGAERDVFPVACTQGIPVVTFTGLRWKALMQRTPDDPPGWIPPSAIECYRFCLASPHVAVALTAPANREQMDENLKLLDDWRPPAPEGVEALRRHGDRVHSHAAEFW